MTSLQADRKEKATVPQGQFLSLPSRLSRAFSYRGGCVSLIIEYAYEGVPQFSAEGALGTAIAS
jgi:hypothetical protein